MSDTVNPETPSSPQDTEPTLVEIVVRDNVSKRLTMAQALQHIEAGKPEVAARLLRGHLDMPALKASARIEALMLRGVLGAVKHGVTKSRLLLSAQRTLDIQSQWIAEQIRAADLILEDTDHGK